MEKLTDFTNLKRLYNMKNLYNNTENHWVLNEVLKEMTDGFYIDINNQKSTEVLDSKYRWRGICISNEALQRGNLCTTLNIDINNNVTNLHSILAPHMVGNVIHFMSIKNVDDLDTLFNAYYNDAISSVYNTTKYYWRKQIITLEIFSTTTPSTSLTDKLRSFFNLELIYADNNQYRFINSVYTILLRT